MRRTRTGVRLELGRAGCAGNGHGLPSLGKAAYAEFMHVTLHYGHAQLECELRDQNLIGVQRGTLAKPLRDPAAAVRAALETPIGFPPLRRALTPDDHVTIVVDERLPHVVQLLVPILEHLTQAQVAPSAVTLLCPQSESRQEWLEDLPQQFQEMH